MKPMVLCIMDGVGIREEVNGNAVKQANMPTLNYLMNKYPNSLLNASGTYVGLPDGQMGNSEVGHTNIGAGKVCVGPLEQINDSIKNNTLELSNEFISAINYAVSNNSKLHIMGLLSDGGIHSNINHLLYIIDILKKYNFKKIYYHIFLDGRDTLPTEALKYIDILDKKIKETGIGIIASVHGRYYAMDRDSNYDRIKKSYDVLMGNTDIKYSNAKECVLDNYKNNITDEFVIPSLIEKEGVISDSDSILVFNYRPDRLRELFSCLTNKDNKSFDRLIPNNLKLVTMFPVSSEVICTNIFDDLWINNSLGEYLGKKGLKQLRIAETEKYAHVTYFFDGGKELNIPNCDRILVPSLKVKTYDLSPKMCAREITNKLLAVLNNYDVVILNYANGDMVGHTGNLNAAIESLEELDKCLKLLYDEIIKLNGVLIVTADHGNCEYMLDDNNNIITSHTTNLVPFIVTKENIKLNAGKLADIAPTMLYLLGLEIPAEMSGKVLIEV